MKYTLHDDLKCDFPCHTAEYQKLYRRHIKEFHPEIYAKWKENSTRRNRIIIPSVNERRYIRKERCVLVKGGKCQDCGIEYNGNNLAIFDFHHIRGKDKNISQILKPSITDEELKEEIDKCDLLCSNCHRMTHFRRAP